MLNHQFQYQILQKILEWESVLHQNLQTLQILEGKYKGTIMCKLTAFVHVRQYILKVIVTFLNLCCTRCGY